MRVDGGYFPSSTGGSRCLGFAARGGVAPFSSPTCRVRRVPSSRSSRGLQRSRSGRALSTLWSRGRHRHRARGRARTSLRGRGSGSDRSCFSSRDALAPLCSAASLPVPLLVSLYALATRLFPGHIGGTYDPSSGYQLAEPLGYWNALGLLTALALLLVGGFVAHGEHVPDAGARGDQRSSCCCPRSTSPSPAVPSPPSPSGRSPRSCSTHAACVCSPPHCSWALRPRSASSSPRRSHALTAPGASLHDRPARRPSDRCLARHARARLRRERRSPCTSSTAACGFRVVPASSSLPLSPRCQSSSRSRSWSQPGDLVDVVERAADAFGEEPPPRAGDLQRRLLSTSGSGRSEYSRVAWSLVRDEPLLGGGAGSFEARWFRERTVAFQARDAHNLYLETLAELGPVALALLLATLALPLLALRRARVFTFAPAAAGAYVAYLAHAGVDWDWEIPAVTVSAIFCAAVLLASNRTDEPAVAHGPAAGRDLALLAPLAAVALVMHVGNRAAAAASPRSRQASPRSRLKEAKRAISWAPWSEEAWQLRGEAELLLGDDGAARRSFDRALDLNPKSWTAWLDLAAASRGELRTRALRPRRDAQPVQPRRSASSKQNLYHPHRRCWGSSSILPAIKRYLPHSV